MAAAQPSPATVDASPEKVRSRGKPKEEAKAKKRARTYVLSTTQSPMITIYPISNGHVSFVPSCQ
jgi:phosphoenolpyruvate synthase/pyruvate phosphate dikinase